MSNRSFRAWLPTLATIFGVALVAILKIALLNFLNFDSPILLFFSAIAFAAWFGGQRQGFLATALSVSFILTYLFAFTSFDLTIWAIRLTMLSVDGIVISFLCGELHRTSQLAKIAGRESQLNSQRFEKIFTSDMIGIIISDLEGNITEANDYFLNMVGYSREDLNRGLSWKMLTSPDSLDVSLNALNEVIKTGIARPFEKEYLRADGRRVVCSVAATRVNANQMLGFILDVTDAKRTQLAQLSESQIFLDSVVENIPNMIFVKDAKTLRFVRFNLAGEKLLGLDSDHLLGRSDFDLFPREQAEDFVKADREVLAGGVTVDIPEEPIQTPEGVRLLHTKKIPIFDQDGEAQYLLGISEDITERRKADAQRLELMKSELALSEAEKTAMRLAFLSEASAALNRSLDIHAMLNTFARVLIRDMSSTCVIDILDEGGQSFDRLAVTRGSRSGMNSAIDSHIVADFEKIEMVADVETGPMSTLRNGRVQLHPLLEPTAIARALTPCPDQGAALNRHGAQSMLVVPILYGTRVLGAITLVAPDGYQAYDELDVSLAQDIAKRAAFAIENANLFSRANEASRAKSAFLANISHEIRTPLGAMIGFAELSLEEGSLNPAQSEHIQKIVKNGQQLLRIVNDVLDISKVESDHLQVDRIDFSLSRLLDEVISLLRNQAESKGLELKLQKAPDLPDAISTDPLRLRQILINMIGNAIKFTEKGHVEVVASVDQKGADDGVSDKGSADGASLLAFRIRDTGLGINEVQARRLFEPFVQADESMARKFGGTGLGLHLSRKLARLLGGDVSLESSIHGQGSCFLVNVAVELAASPALTTPTPAPVRQTPKLQGRLLVVEDSVDNQILIQAFLAGEDLQIDLAANGREGLDLALQKAYDLILMDIQMPVMDGFEAIRQLRAHGYFGQVVALTAHGMKGDRERCLEQGFNDYLSKPITRQSLVECVQQNLGAKATSKGQASNPGLESSPL